MIADYHLHTRFSGDSDADPHDVCKQAIQLGMKSICITDHCDTDSEETEFILDTEAYIPYMTKLKEEYEGRLDLRIGVELGLQTHLAQRHVDYVLKYPFDFVIGSRHMVNGVDPYYADKAFAGKEDREIYKDYLEQLLENIQAFHDYQVVGHIDYVVRYGRHQEEQYSYKEFAEIIDAILAQVIHDDRGIEINTAGLYKGLSFPHPHYDIIKRYKEMGGKIITLGSDAHEPSKIGSHFPSVIAYLKEIGFEYIAEYRQKIPSFIQI